MRFDKSFFKFTTAFLFLLAVFGVLFYFYYLQNNQKWNFEEENNQKEFGLETVKNGELNIYCYLQLQEGSFETESLADFCKNNTLPPNKFSVEVQKSALLDDLAVLLVSVELDGFFSKLKLVSISKERGHFATLEIEERPSKILFEEEYFLLSLEKEVKRYKIVGNNFEEVVSERRKIASPDFGFSVEIPKNWDFLQLDNVFLFYNPLSKEIHNIRLVFNENEKPEFFISKNNPYQKEFEQIKASFNLNQIKELSDYRKFRSELSRYLEINIPEQKITYLEENELIQSFGVLASGDPKNWNGTPGGLYQIISKEGLRFSTETRVYMPFSMRFYGKYLLHGEAYFPSGAPYLGTVSGGCVRVRNYEVEDLYNLVFEGLPVLAITHQKTDFLEKGTITEIPKLTADSFLVADINSGKVFLDRNPEKTFFNSSVSKIMTALVAVEHMGTTSPITVRDYMIANADVTPGIYNGRRVRMIDLLAPLLISSSDSAELVLSHFLGRDNTLERKNEKASSINMENSSFFEWNQRAKNLTTAKDVYYLAYYLFNTRVPLLKITKGEPVSGINYQVFPNIQNRNIFFDKEDFLGGMIDFSPEVGYSGFFIFELEINEEKRELVFVLLGLEREDDLKNEVLSIKKWIKESFKNL